MGSQQSSNILVIESDPEGRSFLRSTLSTNEYLLSETTTATAGLKQIEALCPDAILLDPVLPDMHGLDVIRQVRLLNYIFPIIVLSDKANELDKVTALDAGADDFLEKPFGVGELLARLRAALRRVLPFAERDEPVFRTGDLSVNFANREVRVAGQAVHLTPIEFNLLRMFTRYPNRILTHSILIREIWGAEGNGNYVRSLRVYMGQLRRKLGAGSRSGSPLQTKAGIGYQFQID